MSNDGWLDVEGAWLRGLVDKLAVWFTRSEGHFQSTLYAHSVCKVDGVIVVRVESPQHGTQTFYSFIPKLFLQLRAQIGVGVRQTGDALT